MKIRHIKPEHADFKAHIHLLKTAFDQVPNRKAEFSEMETAVTEHRASFYQMKEGCGSVRLVSQIRGNTFFIWGMSGKGLVNVAPAIIERVKACGYSALEFVTYKNGMRRILRSLGFVEVERNNQSGGIETRHRLDVEGN